MNGIKSHLPWVALGTIGAVCLAFISIERGEPVNALWIVIGAICTYLVSFRYYSLFIANKVMRLDSERPRPRSA